MRRSAHFVAVSAAATFAAALVGCGFTPKAEMTGGATGAANSSGHLTGTGNSTGAGATSGGGGSPGGSSNPDVNCGIFMQGAQMVPPDILIVQDKSGSMNDQADGTTCNGGCGANSKWTQTTTAINMVVGSTQANVNWGLKFFATSNSGCNVSTTAEVPVGPNNANAIMTAIGRVGPGSSTPTRVAMENAVTIMQGLTDTNPKYLLLATDGLPNCMPGGGSTSADDSPGAIAAVAAALTAGFPTFVVGIGNTMGTATLNSMAMAGGRPQQGAATSFYQVNDTASLVSALQAIVGSVASCTFNLGTPPNGMTSNSAIDVYGDGTMIPKDTSNTNGWNYVGGGTSQIQIFGPTCDAIMAGTVKNVVITYICIVN
jgi:hypothetical protein